MKEIAIIIINWNGKELLKDCLESLRAQTHQNFRIILVDNGSTDDSVFFVKENYPKVEIINLIENTGFAYANNIGIQKAFANQETKHVLFLNNDTKADQFFLENLVKAIEENSEFSIFQPKVLRMDNPLVIDTAGIALHWSGLAFNLGDGKEAENFENNQEIFAANATASIFSREALEKINLSEGEYFDNDYFAYYEDVDLGWRLRLQGKKCLYVPNAVIYHKHSATGKRISTAKLFWIQRNSLATQIKNLSFCRLMMMFFTLPLRYIFATFKNRGNLFAFLKAVVKSWIYIIANLKSILKKRRFIQSNKRVSNQEIKSWFKKYKINF